jgi:oxygen-independent coproporphyrinogen-3 oxidase
MSQEKQNKLWGLYIHIPFCVSKCRYCAFYSIPSPSPDLAGRFISALAREMEFYRDCGPFDTVYLGGGTPSVLKTAQIESILRFVRRNFRIGPGAEITVEANPADVDLRYAAALLGMGVNRLNLGVQSFAADVLQYLGRRHSPREAVASVEAAREAGFRNLGLDLIYSIPGQKWEQWRNTLTHAVSFRPEHLSCYELTLEPGTPLAEEFRRLPRRRARCREEDETGAFLENTSAALEEQGYIHYEVSNFSLPGRESRHNRKYWDHTPYLGLGPAAHSFHGRRRWWNMSSVEGYAAAILAGSRPVEGGEELTDEQMGMETLFLGLRTSRGVAAADLAEYGLDLPANKNNVLAACRRDGLVFLEDGRIRPTPKGMAVADALARDLLS